MLKLGMEIKNLGGLTYLLKGKKESVLIDPDSAKIAKNQSRIIIYTEAKYEELRMVDEKVSIMGPGEYEIGGVEVNGFSGGRGKTIYTILIDGVTVAIMGKLEEELNDKRSDRISGVDVLLAEVQNGYKVIAAAAKKWGANYIVPVDGSGEELKKFMDEADCEGQEGVESLKVDKDNLPDGMEIVVLK